jgi:hypothetical protein
MSSQEIEKLLESPDAHASQEKALLLLDTRFHSVDELGDLDAVVENALAVCEDLRAQVRARFGATYQRRLTTQ